MASGSTPRSRATRRAVVSRFRPSIVARTMLCGFVEPRLFVRMSRIPAHSSTARTGPPAITPVPDAAGAVFADDLVRNRAARERHFRHAAARRFDRLAHRFADLVRLTGRDAHVALAVPNRDERVEAEAPAALHDFGDAIDRDDVFDHAVAVAPAPVAAVAPLAAAPSAAAAASTGATLAAGAARRPVLHCRRCFGYRWNVRHRNAGRSRCFFLLIVH